MFEDDETLQMYIEESLEHLSNIENDLLAIEEGGKNIDIDLVNNVFRAAHSIKGGAGFMGLTIVKDLSHSLENVLDLIRNMKLVPNSERISILLKGFDRLKNLMNDIHSSNDQDVSDHIEALSRIAQPLPTACEITQPSIKKLKTIEAPAYIHPVDIHLRDGRVFSQVSLSDLERQRDDGHFIFLVEYDLIPDIHQKNTNPFKLLTTLEKTGVILDARIDFKAVGTLDESALFGTIPLQILYSSIIEPDMAETLFGLETDCIHVIDEAIKIVPTTSVLSSPQAMPGKNQVEKRTIAPALPAIQQKTLLVQRELAGMMPAGKAIITENENSLTEATTAETHSKAVGSLRVNVNLLDALMTLAGELVLSRNQLVQGINSSNKKATELARAQGIKAGLIRPITLFPYPVDIIKKRSTQVKKFLTVEMNAGQMVEDVRLSVNGKVPVEFYGRMGGIVPSPDEVLNALKTKLQ